MVITRLAFLVFLVFQTTISRGQEGHFVTSEGVDIYYSTLGSGPPILIINGGPGFSSEGFIPLAETISKEGFQAILYDQRGTGKSSMDKKDSTNITMELMNKDIEAIRKDLEIDEWIVMGHSFGGMMANYYAAKHPSRVRAMVSSSSGGIDLALLGNAQEDLYSKLSQTEIDSMQYWSVQMHDGGDFEYARKQFARYMAPAYVYDRKHIPIVAERLTQGDLSLNRMVWDDLIRTEFDCKPELRSFDKPVLIIQGKEDVISEELANQADSVLPNSKVVLLDSCSHYGWLDQPEKYFKSIFDFLEEVDQYSADKSEVRKVLENYVRSIYDTDSSLVETIADSSLQKSGHYYSMEQKAWSYSDMDFSALQHTAATYNRKGMLPEWAPIEIDIYEVMEKVASAKVKAIWGFDYVLLSKKDGNWMMDKVLWQSYTAEERDPYFMKLKAYSEVDETSTLAFPDVQDNKLYRGALTPDGSSFYYFKKTGAGENYRIFMCQMDDDGLTNPELVDLGAETSDLYPTISPDGKKLVFVSYRKSPENTWSENAYLWYADRKSNQTWSEPQFLKSVNFRDKYHSNPIFTADGDLVFRVTEADWNSSTTYIAHVEGSGWATPAPYEPVEQWKAAMAGYYVWGGVPGPNEDFVVLDVSEKLAGKKKGPSDLWISYLNERTWTKPVPMGAGVNKPESWENFPFFSPDGNTMYFMRDFSSIHFVETSRFQLHTGKS